MSYKEEHEKIFLENKQPYETLLAHKPHFNFAELPLLWRDNSPIKTFYDNAFSIAVPVFEDFMINGLSEIKSTITDAKLKQQIEKFCAQEDNHAQGHRHLNAKLKEQTLKTNDYIQTVNKILNKYKNKPIEKRLQLFALIETFTSVMAKFYLVTSVNEVVFPEAHRLLVWHSIEELEHRCVAYDVHIVINGKHKRNVGMVLNFCRQIGFYLISSMLKQLITTKLFYKKKTWTDIFWLVSNKGPNIMILKGMINFLRPSYNPKHYFNEPLLNEKVREWEKAFHTGKNKQ